MFLFFTMRMHAVLVVAGFMKAIHVCVGMRRISVFFFFSGVVAALVRVLLLNVFDVFDVYGSKIVKGNRALWNIHIKMNSSHPLLKVSVVSFCLVERSGFEHIDMSAYFNGLASSHPCNQTVACSFNVVSLPYSLDAKSIGFST